VPAPPAGYEASATRVASGRVHRAGVRETPMHRRVVGLRAGAAGEMRPGKVPGSGVTAAAHISGLATAHGVPAAREVASSSEVAPAPSSGVPATAASSRVAATTTSSRVAATTTGASSRVAATAASRVRLRICQSRRTCYRNAEQQGSDGPYKCARSVHSDHSVAVAAVLEGPPATGLDASRARLFKLTHIKTRSRTGALTAIARMRAA
jgi:hypothetical protein